MLRKINNILEKLLGVRVHKVAKSIKLKEGTQWKDNFIIEFYGASGVGKTTLYNHYI